MSSCAFNTYKISITDAETYRPIIKDHRAQIHTLMQSDELRVLRDFLSTSWAKIILFFYSMLPNASKSVFTKACQVMADELTYPTDDGAPMYVGMFEIILMQMYYDAIARCTSVVVRDENEEIMHGRTMDWEMESGGLDALTINVEGYDGDELIFRGISWAGMVGLFTGTNVKSKFSISINYRPDVRTTDARLEEALKHILVPPSAIKLVNDKLSELHKEILIGFLRAVDPTNMPCAVLVYKVLSGKYQGWTGSYEMSFDLAVKMLTSQQILSQVYFTIAGEHDAHVLARNVYGLDQLDSLGQAKSYIMVANKDWWTSRSIDIMNSARRRKQVDYGIGSMRRVTESKLESIMKSVVNSITIYGVIMRPSNGSIRVFHCKAR